MRLHLVLVFVIAAEFGSCQDDNDVVLDSFQQDLRPEQSSAAESYSKPDKRYTVKVIVHVDKALSKKLPEKFSPKSARNVELLMEDIFSNVEKMYQKLSNNTKVKFMLLNTRFLKNKTEVVKMDNNSSIYLDSYCAWQMKKKERFWYYSILLTGLDLYRFMNGRKAMKNTGLSYISGMCSYRYSCAILEWHPKNIVYMIAHEIAHSLGISHDARPYNPLCEPKGFIMSNKYKTFNNPTTWSSCSTRSFKRYLASERSWCLKSDYVPNLLTELIDDLTLI